MTILTTGCIGDSQPIKKDLLTYSDYKRTAFVCITNYNDTAVLNTIDNLILNNYHYMTTIAKDENKIMIFERSY